MKVTRIAADEARCVGCRLCELACSNANFNTNNPKKSAIYIFEKRPEPEGFGAKICTQCGICARECPEGAIVVNGAYVIDEDKCTRCGVCVEVCPLEVIWWRPGVEYPVKCISCGACIDICPKDVLRSEQVDVAG